VVAGKVSGEKETKRRLAGSICGNLILQCEEVAL
jgi:hypothetical protein